MPSRRLLGVISIIGGVISMLAGYSILKDVFLGGAAFLGGICWIGIGIIFILKGGDLENTGY
jgi:hypothetical protein